MERELESALERRWAATCRVLFGTELGALGGYSEWLGEYALPVAKRKSHISGKEVIIARDTYPASARFVSEDELVPNKDYALSINSIKDIDSIAEALREKMEYTGNRFLGNSSFVEKSDIVLDSQYVYGSTNIEQSSYVHSSYMMRRGSRNVFGSGWTANGEFLVRVVGAINLHRCFESHIITDSSDLYFCFNCDGCHDAMFSFGQKNRSHLIGNLQLPKEKYRQLKAKLVEEVAGELEREKRYPGIFELAPSAAPKPLPAIAKTDPRVPYDIGRIEKGFSSVYAVMLKSKAPSITRVEGWLGRNTIAIEGVQTAFGARTYVPAGFGMISHMPHGRAVTVSEALELGKIPLREDELSSIKSIARGLERIAYFTAEFWSGENVNIMDSPIAVHSANVYKGFESTYSDNTGLTSLSLHSKFVYGCNRVIECEFSLKCYNSLYLNRCLELDSCIKCADSYFCHNSEALQDCMFCFNMKGRRHCVGNTSLGKDGYRKVKESLVAQMAGEIERTEGLRWSIYNIGAKPQLR
jgi:hypothetical protein